MLFNQYDFCNAYQKTFYWVRNSPHAWAKTGKNGMQYSTPVAIYSYTGLHTSHWTWIISSRVTWFLFAHTRLDHANTEMISIAHCVLCQKHCIIQYSPYPSCIKKTLHYVKKNLRKPTILQTSPSHHINILVTMVCPITHKSQKRCSKKETSDFYGNPDLSMWFLVCIKCLT